MTKIAEAIHSLFAFSAAPRWVACPGSMAYPENTADGGDAGEYADEGTAAHTLASWVLKDKRKRCEDYLGQKIQAGKREFTVTEEFADHVQTYVDDVQRRAIGGFLMVEQRVTLDGVVGFDKSNYGTSDAVIAIPARHVTSVKDPIALHGKAYGVVEDLKFGQGEKVYAWLPAYDGALFTMVMYTKEDEQIEVEPNYQLMMYALACLADIRLLVDDPVAILIVINQPRLGILSELWVPIAVLERFALFASEALLMATVAMNLGVAGVEAKSARYLNPGEKQCRWCKALAFCPAAAKKAQEETSSDFDIVADKPPVVPVNAPQIAKAMLAVPFVADWCRAVMAKAHELVDAGTEILGPDKKPYKFVEGDLGSRKWKNAAIAEAALIANLPREKVYVEKMITAPAAGKILNKKATKQTWADIFEPLISRAPGKPILALGSDPRPPYSPVSESDEFDVEEDAE
jgi:Protein of unknown function (DUF2800)